MSAAKYVGRLGSLAVVFGVGTGVMSSVAIASADTGESSRGPSASNASSASSASSEARKSSGSTGRGPGTGRSGRSATRDAAAPASQRLSPAPAASMTPRSADAATAPKLRPQSPLPSPAPSTPGDAIVAAPTVVANAEVSPRRNSARIKRGSVGTGTAQPAPGIAAASTVTTNTDLSSLLTEAPQPAEAPALTAVPDPNALAPKVSLEGVAIMALSTTLSFTVQMLQQIAIAVHIGPSRSTFNQTIDFNGSNLVPSSTELVTSFYGPWTYAPGGQNIVQGQQDYNVVDPDTQQTAGSFEALVSSGLALGWGEYAQLLVTSADGDIGTGAGQVPPAGSVIASMKILGGFGWLYSALPSGSGNEVSFKLRTPFGNIPLPFINFDAAQGIADHTVDNRPVYLGNGYSLAPSDPTGGTFTGQSGFLPLFQTVQSRQLFDIRDSSGTPVGTFDAEVTTTWDILGTYTEAILVTESYGDNVGTGIGQVPPPGTVYNVIYSGNDENFGLYTSMPSASGDLISMIQVSPGKVANIAAFPLNILDASAPPAVKRLPFAGGYGILPTSEMIPSGINGLPPRDVQVQGFQQFAVYDRTGVQQGSFDAMVAKQWDLFGITSQGIIVTKVTEGTAGSDIGEIPPVGSVLNYLQFGNTGFGTSYWSLPSESGTKISYKIVTPILEIPTWSTYNASAGMDTVTFLDPFPV